LIDLFITLLISCVAYIYCLLFRPEIYKTKQILRDRRSLYL